MSANLSSLNQAFILKYVAVSGNSLLLHDYLITFSSEVEYMWKAPWTFVKAGFLLNRYGNLVGQTVITLQQIGVFGPGSQEFCNAFCLYYTLFMFFSSESVRLVVTMRAWAIWGCTYHATVWLFSLYTLYLVTVFGFACYFWRHSGAFPPIDGVCLARIAPFAWPLWAMTMVIDSIVLMLVCHRLRKSFTGFRSNSTSPLIRLLVRDAISFYAASMFNNGFSIICWTIFRQDPRAFLQLVFSFPILSIAGQRLVLNLRGMRARPCTSSFVSRMVDQQLAGMDDEWWHPVDVVSPGAGTTDLAMELTERPAR
ncbi:hypothetical protein OG21DRAFT_1516019 [Imleria badia]|nr:hypothetical protein OG21DRAFT_1516019 [Imleria badia]